MAKEEKAKTSFALRAELKLSLTPGGRTDKRTDAQCIEKARHGDIYVYSINTYFW